MTRFDPAVLEALRRIDTPTVSNVIELFHVVDRNRGYCDARLRAAFPELPPAVGFACTAAFRSDQPPPAGDAYTSIDRQVQAFDSLPGPALVVFQDLDDPPVAATFGEVMCSTYQAFGSVGLVTSGAGRDLEQVRALNYPVFTSGAICSHGHCHLLHLGLPVRVAGLTISQGELLHADANGLTRIPLAIAAEIPQVAAEFIAAEQIVLNYVRGPGPKTAAGWNEARAEYASVVRRLEQRVRRA
jgi:regulator of RNase E activity RraA